MHFKDNIRENIRAGAPGEKFLWPQYLTETKDGSFGYLMKLIPSDYDSFSNILRTYKLQKQPDGKSKRIPVQFASLDAMLVAAIHISQSSENFTVQEKLSGFERWRFLIQCSKW